MPQEFWSGQVSSDPLTFILGTDLSTDQPYTIEFGGADGSHLAITGAYGSRTHEVAEVIAAQVLIKTMPWDSELRGQVHIFAGSRALAYWADRQGVSVSANRGGSESGQSEYLQHGVAHLRQIENVVRERYAALAAEGANNWVNLTDTKKREHQFAPVVVIVADLLHLVLAAGRRANEIPKDEKQAAESMVAMIRDIARVGRAVGVHLVISTERYFADYVDSVLNSSLELRIYVGNGSREAHKDFFKTPQRLLPKISYQDEAGGEIPGRAMAAVSNAVIPVQLLMMRDRSGNSALDVLSPS